MCWKYLTWSLLIIYINKIINTYVDFYLLLADLDLAKVARAQLACQIQQQKKPQYYFRPFWPNPLAFAWVPQWLKNLSGVHSWPICLNHCALETAAGKVLQLRTLERKVRYNERLFSWHSLAIRSFWKGHKFWLLKSSVWLKPRFNFGIVAKTFFAETFFLFFQTNSLFFTHSHFFWDMNFVNLEIKYK